MPKRQNNVHEHAQTSKIFDMKRTSKPASGELLLFCPTNDWFPQKKKGQAGNGV